MMNRKTIIIIGIILLFAVSTTAFFQKNKTYVIKKNYDLNIDMNKGILSSTPPLFFDETREVIGGNTNLTFSYNEKNLKITSNSLDTIQDININSSPQFANLILENSGSIKPDTDSTNAINISQSDGTSFATIDTVNKRMSFRTLTDPTDVFEIGGNLKINQVIYPASAVTLTNAGSGNVNTGTHYYRVLYVDSDGKYTELSPIASITLTSNSKVLISNIPTSSDPRVIYRRIYRTKATSSTNYFFLTQINDNTTTTFEDNVADASLGAQYYFSGINNTANIVASGSYNSGGINQPFFLNFYPPNRTVGTHMPALQVADQGSNYGWLRINQSSASIPNYLYIIVRNNSNDITSFNTYTSGEPRDYYFGIQHNTSNGGPFYLVVANTNQYLQFKNNYYNNTLFAVGARDGNTIINGDVVKALPAPSILTLTAGSSGSMTAGTYYYRVTALNETGETTGSAIKGVSVGNNGSVSLSWTPVQGATSYKIYRSSTYVHYPFTSPAYIGSTSNTTYTDTLATPNNGTFPEVSNAYVVKIGNDYNMNFAEGANLSFGTSTGSKIGESEDEKIGFWGATPTIQPDTNTTSATFTENSGTCINENSTFDGYTLAQVVAALRKIGVLK